MGETERLVLLLTAGFGGSGGVSQYTGKLKSALESQGVDVAVSSLPPGTVVKIPTWVKIVCQQLRKKPRAIHCQYAFTELGVFGPLFLLLLSVGTDRLVVTAHEHPEAKVWYLTRLISVPPMLSPVVHTVLLVYDWLVAAVVDVVVVHTDEHAERLQRYPLVSVAVIPHYVDARSGDTYSDRVGGVVADELRQAGGPVLTTFGRVTPKKGHQAVIDALTQFNNAVYVIAGATPSTHDKYRQKLAESARRNNVSDRVVFTGFVEEEQIDTLFDLTDAAILPYRQVTQSGALYDAVGRGCPVVTTKLPAFNVVKNYGFGEQFSRAETSELVEKVDKVLTDHKRYVRQADQFASEHSLVTVATQHCNLYGIDPDGEVTDGKYS